MAALIDWMRAYNATVSDEKKVRFHGMDVLGTTSAGEGARVSAHGST